MSYTIVVSSVGGTVAVVDVSGQVPDEVWVVSGHRDEYADSVSVSMGEKRGAPTLSAHASHPIAPAVSSPADTQPAAGEQTTLT